MREQHYFPPELRPAFGDALPKDAAIQGQTPSAKWTYVPATHRKALDPEKMLVQGIRGSGKTYWCTALQDASIRRFYGENIGLDGNTRITVGFGEKKSLDYPAKETLTRLVDESYDPHDIWRTVCLMHVLKGIEEPALVLGLDNWKARIDWVRDNDEAVNKLWIYADKRLEQKKWLHIILFDALDLTADSWDTKAQLMRGVLQTSLEMRPTAKIRLKIFARPDQLNDNKVRDFTDASKLINQSANLNWTCADLSGLLWQHLANSTSFGTEFRRFVTDNIGGAEWKKIADIHLIPRSLGSNEEHHKYLYHAIVGKWMGNNRRRGQSYSWLFNHLGDTVGNVAPRTFLTALWAAATNTNDRLKRDYILHPEDVKTGVQDASKARTQEIEEEYSWVPIVLRAYSVITFLNTIIAQAKCSIAR